MLYDKLLTFNLLRTLLLYIDTFHKICSLGLYTNISRKRQKMEIYFIIMDRDRQSRYM